MILFCRKGGNCALFLPSGEDGFGQSPNWVKRLVTCGFSGQSPELSESFSISISAIFKVLLSLIFSAQFFIGYLTLPIRLCSLTKGLYKYLFYILLIVIFSSTLKCIPAICFDFLWVFY